MPKLRLCQTAIPEKIRRFKTHARSGAKNSLVTTPVPFFQVQH